jgi:hypothetical protein
MSNPASRNFARRRGIRRGLSNRGEARVQTVTGGRRVSYRKPIRYSNNRVMIFPNPAQPTSGVVITCDPPKILKCTPIPSQPGSYNCVCTVQIAKPPSGGSPDLKDPFD